MHSFLFTEHTSADKELLNWLYVIVSSMKTGVNTREQYNVKCCQNETDFILDLFIQVKMCQCVCPARFMVTDTRTAASWINFLYDLLQQATYLNTCR